MFNPFQGRERCEKKINRVICCARRFAIKSLFLDAASWKDALTVLLVYRGTLYDSKAYDNDQVNCIANVLRFHLHKYSSVFAILYDFENYDVRYRRT